MAAWIIQIASIVASKLNASPCRSSCSVRARIMGDANVAGCHVRAGSRHPQRYIWLMKASPPTWRNATIVHHARPKSALPTGRVAYMITAAKQRRRVSRIELPSPCTVGHGQRGGGKAQPVFPWRITLRALRGLTYCWAQNRCSSAPSDRQSVSPVSISATPHSAVRSDCQSGRPTPWADDSNSCDHTCGCSAPYASQDEGIRRPG